MTYSALSSDLKRAASLLRSGRCRFANDIYDEIVEASPDSNDGLYSRVVRAKKHEDGSFDGGLDAALDDYMYLFRSKSNYSSEGALGCARVWQKMTGDEQIDIVVDMAKLAIEFDNKNVRAMLFLGWVYENSIGNLNMAKHYYVMAFRRGTGWGMRFAARLDMRRGRYAIGVLEHMVSTILSPVMFLFNPIYSSSWSE